MHAANPTVKLPDLPALSLPEQDFRRNPPSVGSVTDECNLYLNFMSKYKSNVVTVEETHQPYGVHVQEKTSSFATYALPSYRPEDLINRVSVAASYGKFSMLERTNAKKRSVGKLRDMFAVHAENILGEYGVEPPLEEDKNLLEFMLRGALKQYDPQKTLARNAMQFAFEREQQKIMKLQQQQRHQAPVPNADKPGF